MRFATLLFSLVCAACGGSEQADPRLPFAGRWVGKLITMDAGQLVASCTWNLVPAEGTATSIRGTWSCAQPSDAVVPRIGEGGYLIGQYGESNGVSTAEIAFAAAPGAAPFKMDLFGVFEKDVALRGQVNVSGIAYDNLYVDFGRR